MSVLSKRLGTATMKRSPANIILVMKNGGFPRKAVQQGTPVLGLEGWNPIQFADFPAKIHPLNLAIT